MTLEEAIIQFKEDADNNRADLDMDWAEENEQVAKWLEELKVLREKTQIQDEGLTDAYLLGKYDGIKKGRAEAIDEVVNLYEKWTKLEKPQQAYYWTVVLCKLKEIAEQLKEKKNG